MVYSDNYDVVATTSFAHDLIDEISGQFYLGIYDRNVLHEFSSAEEDWAFLQKKFLPSH